MQSWGEPAAQAARQTVLMLRPETSSQHTCPVEQLLLPEHESTSPVHSAAVVHVRPLAVAQQTSFVESQGPPAPQTIWLGPPSPRGLPPPPSVAPLDDELLVPDDEPPMMIQDPSAPESSPDAPPSPPEEVLVASVAPPSDEETLLPVDPLQAAAPTTTRAPHPSHMFRQSIAFLL
jgi:hypothetical protein